MKIQKIKKGVLLISEPSILNDKSFNRSIIYMAEHNQDGTVGFILNKPTIFVLNDLIPEIENNFKIYKGGPVEEGNLYYIHQIPESIPNSIKISNNLYWGGDFEILTNLLKTNSIKETDIRFFLGYSGWALDQLEDELKEASWLIVENTFPNILNVKIEDLWKKKMQEFGGEYHLWANAPENPSLN